MRICVGCTSFEVKPPQINRLSSRFHQAEHLNSRVYQAHAGVWGEKKVPTTQTSIRPRAIDACYSVIKPAHPGELAIVFCSALLLFIYPKYLHVGSTKARIQHFLLHSSYIGITTRWTLDLLCGIFYTRLNSQ